MASPLRLEYSETSGFNFQAHHRELSGPPCRVFDFTLRLFASVVPSGTRDSGMICGESSGLVCYTQTSVNRLRFNHEAQQLV